MSSTASNGRVENLPLISRSATEGDAADGSDMRGDRGADQSTSSSRGEALGRVASQSSSSSSTLPLANTANNRMTADGHQQQQQYPPASGALYPQRVHFDMHNSPPAPPPYGTNSHEYHDNDTYDGSEDTPAQIGGPTVTCRVCEAEILIDGKNNQHVVRCLQCNEVTPIRAAPPGKKYVRCPCNCLLVCKATSTRIACPRQNCRRVITLVSGPPNSGIPGTAIRAPVGTCRVQCAYCQEVFMFNTLTNQLAICPHCRKSSSVGARFTRSRSLLYFVLLLISSLFLVGVTVAIGQGNYSFFMFAFMIVLLAASAFLTYRFVFFVRIRVSQVLGPL